MPQVRFFIDVDSDTLNTDIITGGLSAFSPAEAKQICLAASVFLLAKGRDTFGAGFIEEVKSALAQTKPKPEEDNDAGSKRALPGG